MGWNSYQTIEAKGFICGHCGFKVASDKGLISSINSHRRIFFCPHCDKPNYFDESFIQYPGVPPGNEVENLPTELKQLYLESRTCCSVNAFTASVLATRKMLMNIAVNQGAKEGLHFVQYVKYLADSGFVPPNGKGWVDHIRKKGNEATHEIALMTKRDAEELISFTEMLLKFIYEFPSRIPPAKPAP